MVKTLSTRIAELDRADAIKRSLGARVAAYYMKKRGWSFEAALFQITRAR